MTEPTGHAAFHLKHVAHGASGNRSDRRAILHESMRHLDPKDVTRHAGRNPSIVPADAHLNAAFVNDGAGGFRPTSAVKEVLDYGDARVKLVRRRITKTQQTTNLFVVHLPKTLCEEVPDFYLRLNMDGSERTDPVTGQPMSRSRWVARDHAEAMRYFQDAVTYLGATVIPGGQAAIHGWATNFDESTPHIQLMADPFAPDPKASDEMPDALRTEFNQAYGSHREVKDAAGRQISGPAKMRAHQAGFREHMVAGGWPVENQVSERHGKELSKSEYEAAMDVAAEAKATFDGVRAKAAATNEQIAQFNAQAAEIKDEFDARSAELEEREAELARREADLPSLRRRLEDEGRRDGLKAAESEIEVTVKQRVAAALNPAQAALERRQEELEERLAQAARERAALRAAIEKFDQMSRTLRPLVEKWEQANPHTEAGAKQQRSAAAFRRLEQRASDVRLSAPDADDEYQF
jgi:hypothetical protein